MKFPGKSTERPLSKTQKARSIIPAGMIFASHYLHFLPLIIFADTRPSFFQPGSRKTKTHKHPKPPQSWTVMCVSVCLPDPVSSSLAQSVMSMASSHSQHSHISTDTMSSMSGSYLAGAEGEPGGDEGGDVDCEENQEASMENRRPSQQDRVSMEDELAAHSCSFK